MRLSFAPNHRTQPVVHPAQIEAREATTRRSPVGRTLAIAAAALLALGVAVWWWRSLSVYTYGVVATGVEAFHAPVRSKVLSVHVEPGDRVTADQVLYLLSSDDAAAEMRESQERLMQEQRVLEVALSQEGSLFEDPIQELRDLSTAQAGLRALAAAQPVAELRRRAAELARAGETDRARRAAEHHAAEAALRTSDRERVLSLQRLGAASADDVRAAEAASREAAFAAATAADEVQRLAALAELAQAQEDGEAAGRALALDQARAHLADLEAAYHDARGLREKEKIRGIENIRSRITSLESRIAHLRTLAGPTEVRALADGVVTEVLASEGSNIPKDGMILTVAGTGKVWINAFVLPERAKEVAIGDLVTVYPTTGATALHGKVTAGGGIQYKVHPSLQGRITDASAVYVRIDLDGPHPDLIPGNVAKVVIH